MKDFKKIFLFLLLFITFFAYYSYTITQLGPLWSYSFSFNISRGFIPYRDFNMIITPFYPLLFGFFMHFINSSFVFFLILHAFLSTLIVYETYRKKEDILLVILLLLFIAEPGYNLLLVYLYYLIVRYKDSKYLLGFLIGLLFLTKQTVGLIFLVIMLLTSKEKIKNSISFMIPVTLSFIYLFINSALYEFIDQTFLGLFNFSKNNLYINPSIIIFLIVIIFLLYKIYKTKFKNSELFYILGFLFLTFPIFDFQHLGIAFLPFLSYYVSKYRHYNKYIFYILLLILDISFINFASTIPNKTKTLKYTPLNDVFENEIINITKNINENKDKEIFIISGFAPIIKIECNIDPSVYDLLNRNNLGYNGTSRYIKYIEKECFEKKCHFILGKGNWQIDRDIVQYIMNNYIFIEKENDLYIYEN